MPAGTALSGERSSPSKNEQLPILPSVSKSLTRRGTPYRGTLFLEELREMYTGEREHPDIQTPYLDFGQVQKSDWRTERLREDLLFMWRTKLYSDVRIEIPKSRQKQADVAVLSAHRFILHSRSLYFARILSRASSDGGIIDPTPDHPLTITFDSQPLTALSFDFILEFIYTGTLKIKNNELTNLNTALSIWKGSQYLELPSLKKLICCHITHNMFHGLCYGILNEKEYRAIVGDSWSSMVKLGGCQCQQCRVWAPRLFEFALDPEIRSDELERGSLRLLVKLFGLGWCTIQFSSLPKSLLDYILIVIRTIIIPKNVLCLLFAAEEALDEVKKTDRPWVVPIKSAVMTIRNLVDDMLCEEIEECLNCDDWERFREDDAFGLMSNAKGIENTRKLCIIRDSIFRSVEGSQQNAAKVYKVRHTNFNKIRIVCAAETANLKVIDHHANLPAKSQSWIRAYLPMHSVFRVHLNEIKVGLRSWMQEIPISPGTLFRLKYADVCIIWLKYPNRYQTTHTK